MGKIRAKTIPLNRQFPESHPLILSRLLIAGHKIYIHNGPIDDVRSLNHPLAYCQNSDVPVVDLGSRVLR